MLIWSLNLANLDPFVIQWPRKWLQDPEIEPVITYLNLFLHNLFVEIDGGEAFDDESGGNDALLSRVSIIAKQIDILNLQINNKAELAVLAKRISELELQQ